MDSSNLVGANFYPLVGDHKPKEFSIPYFEGHLDAFKHNLCFLRVAECCINELIYPCYWEKLLRASLIKVNEIHVDPSFACFFA